MFLCQNSCKEQYMSRLLNKHSKLKKRFTLPASLIIMAIPLHVFDMCPFSTLMFWSCSSSLPRPPKGSWCVSALLWIYIHMAGTGCALYNKYLYDDIVSPDMLVHIHTSIQISIWWYSIPWCISTYTYFYIYTYMCNYWYIFWRPGCALYHIYLYDVVYTYIYYTYIHKRSYMQVFLALLCLGATAAFQAVLPTHQQRMPAVSRCGVIGLKRYKKIAGVSSRTCVCLFTFNLTSIHIHKYTCTRILSLPHPLPRTHPASKRVGRVRPRVSTCLSWREHWFPKVLWSRASRRAGGWRGRRWWRSSRHSQKMATTWVHVYVCVPMRAHLRVHASTRFHVSRDASGTVTTTRHRYLMHKAETPKSNTLQVRPSYSFTGEIGTPTFPDEPARFHLYAGMCTNLRRKITHTHIHICIWVYTYAHAVPRSPIFCKKALYFLPKNRFLPVRDLSHVAHEKGMSHTT